MNFITYSGSYQSSLDIHHELAKNDFISSDIDVGGLNYAYIGKSCQDEALLKIAVEKCMWGKFYNSGQSRSAIEGILVH